MDSSISRWFCGKTTFIRILGKQLDCESEIELENKKITDYTLEEYNELVKTVIPKELIFDETNIVPDVPREILHLSSPTVAVPTADAALSPAPAATATPSGRPSSFAISPSTVPVFS